jgi:hypothetical protein
MVIGNALKGYSMGVPLVVGFRPLAG